ncbi:MAG: SAM-dependent methyltransferase [Clostridia bacterium]|nr:SAM-dependent methyltransferase [Clostridia bacterium]
MNKDGFVSLILRACELDATKRLVFSRPNTSDATKISARLISHRGRRFLAAEYSLPGNTVSQKNISESEIVDFIIPLFDEYRQVNLITTLGDAEWKIGKKGEVVLGGDALLRKTSGSPPDFERAIESLDKKKNYILDGTEPFLYELGISSKDGRIHDKRQGKFRQINRFLEHIEDIYDRLPKDRPLVIYDLCSGKSYLSFAVYYYLTEIKEREVSMLSVDLKRDVILWCEALAGRLGYSGMRFLTMDIAELRADDAVDMVISLHACDIATDIVLSNAVRLGAEVILSTPCCHRYLKDKITAESLKFITDYPHIANKLSEAATDALRLLRLKAAGYTVAALELTDPENTPKNTLIRAVKSRRISDSEKERYQSEYEMARAFLVGDKSYEYL